MNTIKHRAENLNNGGSVTVYYCGYEKCEGGHFWGPAVRNHSFGCIHSNFQSRTWETSNDPHMHDHANAKTIASVHVTVIGSPLFSFG